MAGFSAAVYPNIPFLKSLDREDQEKLAAWWGSFMNELHKRDANVQAGAANGKPFWVVTDVSVNRTYNVSSATVSSTANALGTLLYDLKNKGTTA